MNKILMDAMIENSVIDFKKIVISKYQRAILLLAFMKHNNKSMTDTAKFLGLPKTTLHYWLKWEKLTPTRHAQLINDGITTTQITNALKRGDNIDKLKPTTIADSLLIIQAHLSKIKTTLVNGSVDHKVIAMLKAIVEDANYMLMRAEKKFERV